MLSLKPIKKILGKINTQRCSVTLKAASQSRKRGSIAKVTYFPEACIELRLPRIRVHVTSQHSDINLFIGIASFQLKIFGRYNYFWR